MTGGQLADRLRENGVECEYADPDFLVLMLTPENSAADIERIVYALGTNDAIYVPQPSLPLARGNECALCGRQCLPRGRPYRRRSRWGGSVVPPPWGVRLRFPLWCPGSELARKRWNCSGDMAWSR